MTESPKTSQHPDMSSEGMLARLERLGLGDDTVSDFVAGAGTEDMLDLTAGFAGFSDVVSNAIQSGPDGADTFIQLDVDDSVTLIGVNLSGFHPDDLLI